MTGLKIILLWVFTLGMVLFTPQAAHAEIIKIDIQDMQFTPQIITISPGDTVIWTNKDSVVHTSTSDSQTGSESWDSGLMAQGKTYSKTFTVPGTYSYNCLPHPDMIATIQVTAPSPTPTPPPTLTPLIPTTTQVPTTALPSLTTQPTTLSLTLFLNGIGKAGDTLNKGTGNPNPNRTLRPVTVSLYDTTNKLIGTTESRVTYAPQSGNFAGTATIQIPAAQSYRIKVKTEGFLEEIHNQGLIPGQTAIITPIYVVTGDINNDNQLNALDYNILINCFESKMMASSCTDMLAADMNDDEMVNGIDYNLFLRELSALSRM